MSVRVRHHRTHNVLLTQDVITLLCTSNALAAHIWLTHIPSSTSQRIFVVWQLTVCRPIGLNILCKWMNISIFCQSVVCSYKEVRFCRFQGIAKRSCLGAHPSKEVTTKETTIIGQHYCRLQYMFVS